MQNKCGSCKHARPIPKDLTTKVCFGGPPQVIVAPGPRGEVSVQTVRPHVMIQEEACALFQPKLELSN